VGSLEKPSEQSVAVAVYDHRQTLAAGLHCSLPAEPTKDKFMNRFQQFSFAPRHYDLALLVLRVWIGFSLFIGHGLEKLMHFSQMAAHFPDPIHIGAGPSLAFALLSDGICSVLVIFGIATRWAALIIAINLSVVFSLVHKFAFSGPRSGELPFVYLGCFVALIVAGGGRFSVDAILGLKPAAGRVQK
jgi:putative oxidoreductase